MEYCYGTLEDLGIHIFIFVAIQDAQAGERGTLVRACVLGKFASTAHDDQLELKTLHKSTSSRFPGSREISGGWYRKPDMTATLVPTRTLPCPFDVSVCLEGCDTPAPA